MVWVKANVDPKLYLKVPGQIITLWGHHFTIQKDGSLCMDMHEDFVAHEIRAKRVTKVDPPVAQQIAKKITIKRDLGFTMDIGNYYGAGDLNKLIERVSEFTKPEMIQFIEERFPKNEPIKPTMTKADIADRLRSYIDSKLLEYEED